MSWLDKQHRKIKIDKMIQEAMRRPEYQEARRHDMEQATLRAFCRFCFVSLLYLEMTFRCKRKAFMKFLTFAKKTLEEIGTDTEFIKASNDYYMKEYNLDVMNFLGLKLEEDVESV
jgi:hypothetical protein